MIKIKKIGTGATSVVYLALHAGTMRLVAIKERKIDPKGVESLIKELHELHENLVPLDKDGAPQWIFNHNKSVGTVHPCKHILSFYGGYHDCEDGTLNLCLEFMDSGSLQRVVDAGGVRDERVLQHITYGVLKALEHLQEYKTIHNDIKPANILVSHNGHVKVGDLGLACRCVTGDDSSEVQGTIAFLSPERLLSKPHTYTADIWALGITLITLATGQMPFSDSTGFFHLQNMVVNKPIPGLFAADSKEKWVYRFDGIHSKIWSPQFMTFVTCALIKDPTRRPMAKDLLKHGFLRTHEIKNFEGPDSMYNSLWRDSIDTNPVNGKDLLPIIKCRLDTHLSSKGGILLRQFSPSPRLNQPPSKKLRKVKCRWQKVKKEFLPNRTFLHNHPFVGVWNGIVNLANGLRLPTRMVKESLYGKLESHVKSDSHLATINRS
eukprot:CAMPEP_0167743370 /NCGR_PEP_ID=MMETSP0110_2-20121227/1979_1 /TAXON_ID=629695 /ORGANISM="Gymnochlora sp., Strain CCMP2014" /LENGTH=434 /DNA_ID=CAMNT_0007627735 /DNA_START=144 /DNA_END=1448 /DNA_ORIENTATION=-